MISVGSSNRYANNSKYSSSKCHNINRNTNTNTWQVRSARDRSNLSCTYLNHQHHRRPAATPSMDNSPTSLHIFHIRMYRTTNPALPTFYLQWTRMGCRILCFLNAYNSNNNSRSDTDNNARDTCHLSFRLKRTQSPTLRAAPLLLRLPRVQHLLYRLVFARGEDRPVQLAGVGQEPLVDPSVAILVPSQTNLAACIHKDRPTATTIVHTFLPLPHHLHLLLPIRSVLGIAVKASVAFRHWVIRACF